VLNVQSELHKGSTFTVSFPLEFTPADHRKGPPEDL
jgi:hypothetical protein